ncbi:tyrosine phosphatase family protein [Caulobacter mirabilis]|uniref:Protein tyrosine phosphatase n=1 Tax=Caulobacter mirabilis TaxID=69666 RepID=A0A2D2AZY8_9CAUL|nr:protein tyrosine phosphatase [Caulobacter mirabilis]ATQ43566.1 protein tyrosine phosphatase [Caulobacter mirabilis]
MIIACPASRLAEAIERYRPTHVASLISPDAEAPRIAGVERLVLCFNDIAEPREGLIAADTAIIERLFAFADAADEGPLLVHCFAGVSRSPAAAYLLACRRAGAGEEARLAQTLRAASPEATPNPLMVALADELLERGGAMTAAIAGIGRGREAFEGPVLVMS